METDFEALTRINRKISDAEDTAHVAVLEQHLAAQLAFRRADGTVVNRQEFLKAAKASGPRKTAIQSITLLGRDRAFVTCLISLPVDGQQKTFENARLFVRTEAGEWALLGWANEPARHEAK